MVVFGGRILWTAVAVLAMVVPIAAARGQAAQTGAPPPVGSAERGERLYRTYHCYACHGFTGETGTRLAPLAMPVQGFIQYMNAPPAQAMPAYPDVAAQDLADIHAYIRSMPSGTPPLEEIPILNELIREITAQRSDD